MAGDKVGYREVLGAACSVAACRAVTLPLKPWCIVQHLFREEPECGATAVGMELSL